MRSIRVFLLLRVALVSIPVSSAILMLVIVTSPAFGQPPYRGPLVPEQLPPWINGWIHATELGGTGKVVFNAETVPPGPEWRKATEAEIQAYREKVAEEAANFKLWIDDPEQGGTGDIRGGSRPPGPSPPWRVASEADVAAMIAGWKIWIHAPESGGTGEFRGRFGENPPGPSPPWRLATAAEIRAKVGELGLVPSVPPEVTADSIVVFQPHTMHHLNAPVPFHRTIHGDVVRVEKGVAPKTIVHTAHTIVSGLAAGQLVRLGLKQFKDSDAYYIIFVDHRVKETEP
ncbi:MAG: hypothetical protein ACREM3_00940 [Candidatus Rokuibacteriota bacterium]